METKAMNVSEYDNFERGDYSFVDDNFVHQKVCVVKVTRQNQQSHFAIKQSFFDKLEGALGLCQIKWGFNIRDNISISAKSGTGFPVSLTYNYGINIFGNIYSLFSAGIQSSRNLTDTMGLVSLALSTPQKWMINCRLRTKFSKGQVLIDNKLQYAHKKWSFNAYGTYDLTNKILEKAGMLFSRVEKQDLNGYYLRFDNPLNSEKKCLPEYFDRVTLDWVRKISQSQKVGVELKSSLKNFRDIRKIGTKILNDLWFASEWKLKDTIVKAKVNKDLTHAVVIQNTLGQYGSYSLGMEISDVGRKNKFRFGFQIDI